MVNFICVGVNISVITANPSYVVRNDAATVHRMDVDIILANKKYISVEYQVIRF